MAKFVFVCCVNLVIIMFLLASFQSNVSASPVTSPQQQTGLLQFGQRSQGFGDTNYSCSKPGSFVKAPDGCNRCYCELDGKLSSACSKVLCPSGGFPSGPGRRPVFSNYQFRTSR